MGVEQFLDLTEEANNEKSRPERRAKSTYLCFKLEGPLGEVGVVPGKLIGEVLAPSRDG